ncbi:RHS repeat-associated core domain-containing protein [Anatilimnocola sp. NA78]|uniref:RHS repeat-associated core domain-containing protein n=1 Tax=Anatilimnocola sp. NA78 TaxID=3415683 RepID=UPI003CE4CBDE
MYPADDAAGAFTDALGNTSVIKVDRFGLPLEIIDEDGNVTLFERDDDGRITRQTDPRPDGPLGYQPTPITEYQYDSNGNLEEVTYPDGTTESWVYDSYLNVPYEYEDRNGNLIFYTLNITTGLVDAEIRVVGEFDDLINLETDDVITEFTYYGTPSLGTDPPAGSLASVEDALGRITEFEYDGHGNLTLVRYAVGTALEAEVVYDYDADDQLTKVTDELGRETEFEHDLYGRLVKTILPDPDGSGVVYTSPEIESVYNSLNQLIKTIDPLSRETAYHYDARGNQTQVDLPDHDGDTNLTETIYAYNAGDQIESVTDPLGRVTSFLYDLHGRLTQTTLPDPDGATPTLSSPVLVTEYDALGRVTRTIGARGEETTYAYGNFGREITVTLPDADGPSEYVYSTTTLYREYDAGGNLIEEVDANSNTTTYEYDDLNRLVKIYAPDPDGGGPLTYALTEFEYDKVGSLRFTTDPLGNVTEYQYDARNRQVKVIQPDPDGAGGQAAPETDYEYDDAGQLISVTDPLDRVTEYDYDDLGRLILVTLADPDGGGPLAAPEIGYTYDAAGRKLTMTDPRGNVTAYAYDDLDNLVELTQPDPDGVGGLTSPVTEWEYDAAGQLQETTDPLGRITTYDYDLLGRLLTLTQPDPDGVGGLAAPVTSYTYDASGNLLTATSPLAKVTSYAYDFLNRTTAVTDPLAGVTSFTYDSNGNRTGLTDPEANTTSWAYDAHNRVTQETNALSQSRSFGYDAVGNLTQRTDRLGRVVLFDYDNLYRKTQEQWWANSTFPSSSVYTYTEGSSTNEVQYVGFYDYSADMTSGTFTLTFDGQTTSAIAYNASAGTVQAALEALSNIGSGEVSVTKWQNYGYYQEWEVTFTGGLAGTDVAQITIDASAVYNGIGAPTENETTSYEGSSTNEVQEVTISNADGGTFTLTFSGQTTTALDWDATAGEVETALEALSNIDAVSVSGSAGGPFTITFEGSLAGENVEPLVANTSALTNTNLQRILTFEYDLAGQLTAANDPAAVNYYTYDDLGRVTNETMTFAGYFDTITLGQQYDVAGNRTQTEWAFGTTEALTSNFVYDNLNRLTQLTRSSDEEADFWHHAEFSYNKLGQFHFITGFVGDNTTPIAVVDTAFTYDGLNRLASIIHATGDTTWAGYDYAYDAASRIIEIDSFLDGLSQYDYDDTDQLIDADHTGSTDETYDYDANGNRDTGYTTGTNNQLQSDGTYNYTYDNEGNRLTRTNISTSYVTEYSWDHRNRLVAVTEKDDMSNVLSVVENSYDVFNRWIRRSVDSDGPGGTAAIDSYFAYEGNQLSLEINGDDGSDLSHIYSWGPNVDQLIADITHGSTPNFGLTDHLGTPRDFVAYDAGLTTTVDTGHRIYDSFGTLTFSTGITSFLGYTARPFEITFSLQYNWNRWYDSSVGRWMNEDPIGFAGGDQNLSRYTSNRPVDRVDPNGLETGGIASPAQTAEQALDGAYATGQTLRPGHGRILDHIDIRGSIIASEFAIAIWNEIGDQIENLQWELATFGLGHGAGIAVDVVKEGWGLWRKTKYIAKCGDKTIDVTEKVVKLRETYTKAGKNVSDNELLGVLLDFTGSAAGAIWKNLDQLRTYLQRHGIDLITNGERHLNGNAGGFSVLKGRPTIILPSNPTIRAVFHEIGHALTYLHYGPTGYGQLPQPVREHLAATFVRSRGIWSRIEGEEQWVELKKIDKSLQVTETMRQLLRKWGVICD